MNAALQIALLIATPGAPLALAFASWLWPRMGRRGAPAALAAMPAIAASGLLSPGASVSMPWLLAGSELGIDGVARVFLVSSGLLWAAAASYAGATIEGSDRDRAGFLGFLLFAMSGNFGLIIARDMLVFYLCFTLMSLAAYGMIVHARGPAARAAGRVYLSLVIAGDLMLYAALVIVALATAGELSFEAARAALAEAPGRDAAIALIVLGFGVKIGFIGLHVSLPLIYASAPVAAAAALAGPVINAGILGWLRLLPLGAGGLEAWGSFLIAGGIAAAFYGVLIGATQREARTVLAYSSVSQMGIMTLGIGFALQEPAAAPAVAAAVTLYAMHHAFTKSALVVGADFAARAPAGRAWRTAALIGLVLPALVLAGAPLTGGMPAKELLKDALTVPGAAALAVLLPWTAVATTAVVARFLFVAWPRGDRGRNGATPVARAAWLALLVGAGAAVWLAPAAPAMTAGMLWSATWPILLGTAVSIAAARWLTAPDVPPGDVLAPMLSALRAARRGWNAIAQAALPAVRDRLLSRVAAARHDPRWPRTLERGEERLGAWPVACALVVALILALGAAAALGAVAALA